MKLRCFENEMTVSDKEIHLLNGVLFTDGSFLPAKRFCTNRLNVNFMTQKYLTEHRPDNFMKFLGELLEPDDILTLQEYLGYCLIPTTAAQKALFIIGNGGEGKSCIGIVLSAIFGDSMVSGNFQSIETDRFSRYKLCNKLLMIDDDMQMTALPSTGIIKNLITSQIPVEVEAKGKQSRQVKLYSRFLCFGNGSPRSLYDKSDGFVRRLLILTTKPVPKDRVTDPNITDRFIAEKDMIFMWMFEGLRRLLSNNFIFTVSEKTAGNMNELAAENCNISEFLNDETFIAFGDDYTVSSNELYGGYFQWCTMNGLTALKQETFIGWLKSNSLKYKISYSYNVINSQNKRVRGFKGIRTSFKSIAA